MARKYELKGEHFGHWTVLEGRGNGSWLCRCACGTEKVVRTNNLIRGATESCGCQRGTRVAASKTIHGRCKDRLYRIWRSIKQRTSNVNDPVYGGRGIMMHSPWLTSFERFA